MEGAKTLSRWGPPNGLSNLYATGEENSVFKTLA